MLDMSKVDLCPDCNKEGLTFDRGLVKCEHCKAKHKIEYLAENVLGISDEYEIVKDGGELPIFDCPDCGVTAMVFDDGNYEGYCFCCEGHFEAGLLIKCSVCGTPDYKEDGMSSLCRNHQWA